jgi:hypothetical protein
MGAGAAPVRSAAQAPPEAVAQRKKNTKLVARTAMFLKPFRLLLTPLRGAWLIGT